MKCCVTKNFVNLIEEAKGLLDDSFDGDKYVAFAEKCCAANADDVYVVKSYLKEVRNLEASLRATAKDGVGKIEHAAMCMKASVLIAICDLHC